MEGSYTQNMIENYNLLITFGSEFWDKYDIYVLIYIQHCFISGKYNYKLI